ncbi:50S ribosomal subunit protein L23 [Gammaproteobacteria bacterium]|nr:50S ribosomal subunit protein L23 [Gammaproteobacteria bacterium]
MSTQDRLMQVLLAPHASEKTARIEELANQVTFKVLKTATKHEIKAAIELMFNLKVEGVTVINQKGKAKRSGRSTGYRSDWKKAYVTLQAGQSIDFLNGAQ